MEWIQLAIALLGFVALVFKEIFSAQARAREENRKYELNAQEINRVFTAATVAMRQQTRSDSSDARDVEDQIDKGENK